MIAVTGTSGFLGRAIVNALTQDGGVPRRLLRGSQVSDSLNVQPLYRPDGELDPCALDGCAVVIHAAARAHVLNDTQADRLAVFRAANRDFSVDLLRLAIVAGVRRFIFISSIGVCGTLSGSGVFAADAVPAPEEPYAQSKWEAEVALSELAQKHHVELVIIRLPLIHGPGARGNFRLLLSAIAARKALPLAAVRNNRRSFVGVANAAQAIAAVARGTFPESPLEGVSSFCRVYHIADDGVVSTRRLVEVLAEGLGVSPRLLPLPRWAAMAAAWPLGKAGAVRRLFGNLEVDDSAFRRDWGWQPQMGLEEGLLAMARAWRDTGGWSD